jgi:crotonobetainyl-CoA:carnitine CoA-transferase CaiB-like acyl-CoA transferase
LLAENVLEMPELVQSPKFSSNMMRTTNREELVKIISDTLKKKSRDHWIEKFTGLGSVYLIVTISTSRSYTI